jgi:hypothetical protein
LLDSLLNRVTLTLGRQGSGKTVRRQHLRHNLAMDTLGSSVTPVKLPQFLVMLFPSL